MPRDVVSGLEGWCSGDREGLPPISTWEYLAVGDRISYAVGPSRFKAVYTHYRLECADVARAPRPDPPDASSICAAVVLLGVLMAYDQYFKSK